MKTYTFLHKGVNYTVRLIVGGSIEWSNGVITLTHFTAQTFPREVFNIAHRKAMADGYSIGDDGWLLSSQQ